MVAMTTKSLYLYYQNMRPDCNPELVGIYDSLETLLLKVKEECDNAHEELPDDNPTYDEFIMNNFENYPEYNRYSFHMPTYEEINYSEFIIVIKERIDDEEEAFIITTKEL
jgi:hypothetical protein